MHRDVFIVRVKHRNGSIVRVVHRDGSIVRVVHRDGSIVRVVHRDGSIVRVVHRDGSIVRVVHGDLSIVHVGVHECPHSQSIGCFHCQSRCTGMFLLSYRYVSIVIVGVQGYFCNGIYW